MLHKICAYCGEPFDTKSGTQKFCKRQHYGKCAICGKEYPITLGTEYKSTCSRACGSELRKRTCLTVYGGIAPACNADVRKKMEDTTFQRFGTKSAMQSQVIKDKVVATCIERYNAASPLESEEIKEKIKTSNIKKYGVENPLSSPVIRDKIKATNQERYGVDNAFQSPDIRKKWSDNCYAKTGYKHHWSNPEVIAKSESTWQKHYGATRPIQAEAVQLKVRQTMLDRYGVDNAGKSPLIRAKIQDTNLKKYGSANPMGNSDVQTKVAKTMQDRYGKSFYAQTDESRMRVMRNPERIAYLNEFQQDPISTIDKYFPSHKPTLKELTEFVGTGTWTVTQTIEKFNCGDKVAYVFSYMEKEVYAALKEIDPELNIVTNTHKVITPYEIDIYLPDYKIGIECNPTISHNSSIYPFGFIADSSKRQPMSYSYHKMKSDMCDQKDIFLFHIFGYDWSHKKDIIISMLKNLLGKNSNKVYARDTYVTSMSAIDAADFLNHNHRQGNAQAPIRLGLYHKDTGELLSVMTFGKLRGTIGTSEREDTSDVWELVRFCNKVNTTVVGGASKLFKYFVNQYMPDRIRSFSDRAHTRGGLYSTLGFIELRRSSANYVWVDLHTDTAYHRINAQKAHIRKFLDDDSIDIQNKTERQIMIEHGFVQVYDSGTITWEWRSQSLI